MLYIDHSQAFANAGRAAFSGVTVVTCWPHTFRGIDKNSGKLRDKTLLKTIKEHVELMHLCRSKPQLKALWNVVKDVWVAAGEGAMADWFENEYVADDWATWYVCG